LKDLRDFVLASPLVNLNLADEFLLKLCIFDGHLPCQGVLAVLFDFESYQIIAIVLEVFDDQSNVGEQVKGVLVEAQ
jgi:hypothetical protein